MVRQRSEKMRVHPEFKQFVHSIQDELLRMNGNKPTSRAVTGGIQNFLREEQTGKRMLRRARALKQKRPERFLF